jgi:hypothetical protein
LLWLQINTLDSDNGRHMFSLTIELVTVAELNLTPADPGRVKANVIAWHNSGFGECATENVEKEIRSRVADLVDSFINDYLSSKKGS